jgi:microsomal dipeptidase-like Zn-dependent dipeptidase
MLTKGDVGAIWAAHYVPETQLFDDCRTLRWVGRLFIRDFGKVRSGSRFSELLRMIDLLESEVSKKPTRVEVARSVADLERIRQLLKLAVIHTVEGVHALDGDPDHLDELARRGVASLTLSHFYKNDAFEHTNGVPEGMSIQKMCKLRFETNWGPPAITDFGRAVLAKMKALHIIPDVTHCSPAAREAVYAEINREMPVIATHVGVRYLNADPYNLTDAEMGEIAATGGAVGVIFMNYWLSARRFDGHPPKKGLDIIWDTIERIRDITGSFDYVMLGTDFDGFTDPPDDVRDSSQIWRLTDLLLSRGLSDTDIKKILGGNALRVLKAGWK